MHEMFHNNQEQLGHRKAWNGESEGDEGYDNAHMDESGQEWRSSIQAGSNLGAGLREPELIEEAGCFRVNMFRNTELIQEKLVEIQDKRNTREKRLGADKGGSWKVNK